jgi:hypothetical protein
MASSVMLRRVGLVRTDVSEELSASIKVTRFGELGTTLAVFLRSVCGLLVAANVVPSSPILVILMKEAPSSSETSVLTKVTRRGIPEDFILHSHRGENLKSYTHLLPCGLDSRLLVSTTSEYLPVYCVFGLVHKSKNQTPWISVCKRTTTERPPLVGKVNANFPRLWVLRGQRNGSPRQLISIFYTGVVTFLSSSWSITHTRLCTPFQTHRS